MNRTAGMVIPDSWDEFYKQAPLDLGRLLDTAVWQRKFLGLMLSHSRPGQLCVETGTGTGAMTMHLAAHGRRVLALDLEVDLLRRLRNPLASHLEILPVAGDLTRMPLATDSADVVFSQGVLEHLDDDSFRRGVKEALRVAPLTVIAFPSMGVGHPLFGNENLRGAREWTRLMRPHRILDYRAYDGRGRGALALEELAWWGMGKRGRVALAPILDRTYQQLVFVVGRS